VIAIDIDPVKIACARRNAELYGVANRIEFLVGDYLTLVPHLKAVDVVFLSPPWGGPAYSSTSVFDLQSMSPLNGELVYRVARDVCKNIAFYLPRNTNLDQVVNLTGLEEDVEVEQHFLNSRLKTVTAYFGELVSPHY
jgi:trimethylguanosine synthase